jgi:lipopolysaccharide export system permease protein
MPVFLRYCLLSLISPFLVATGTTLLIMNLLWFSLIFLDYFFKYHAGVLNCFLLFFYYQPSLLVLAIPIGFLIALLMVYGRLGADREFLALQASGCSVGFLLRPLVIFSFAFSLVMVIFMDIVLPWGNKSFIKMDSQIIKEHSSIVIKERVFIDDFPGYILYVDQKEEATGKLKNVTVNMLDERGNPYRVVHASEGSLQQDPRYHIILRLERGFMQQLGTKKEPGFSNLLQLKFSQCDLDLSSHQNLMGSLDLNSPRNMKIDELAKKISDEKLKKMDSRYDEVEFNKKFSLPFSTLAFALIGIPLGLMSRDGSYSGPVLAVLLVAGYEAFLMLGDNGGFLGRFSPFLAMWVPNFFLFIVGVLLALWIDNRLWIILFLRGQSSNQSNLLGKNPT